MLINWLGLKGLVNTIVTFVAFYMFSRLDIGTSPKNETVWS